MKASIAMIEPRRLSDFLGAWRVNRRIVSQDGSEALFEGTASWAEADGGMRYTETGAMRMPDHLPMQAERRYFWRDDLSVFFDDGRFFHQVPPEGGQTSHWCDPDRYHVTYDFSGWPAFQVVWKVNGPRKDYRSVTEYTRC